MPPLPTYRPSGSFNVGVLGLAVLAIVPAALLAFVYQWLVHVIPFVYLNAIVVIVFAVVLGALATKVLRVGRCRNRLLGALLALVIGAGALAASYGWDYRRALSRLGEENPQVPAAEIREQYTLGRHLEARREAGWKVKSSQFNGLGVILVWSVEALGLLGIVAVAGWGAVARPYCEPCGQWTEDRAVTVTGRSREDAQPLLDAGDLKAVVDLAPSADQVTSPALVLTGSLCPQCQASGFLSLSERTAVIEKGKRRERVHPLLAYATLSPELRARFEARATTAPTAS